MTTVRLPSRLTGSWIAAIASGRDLHPGFLDTEPGTWCCFCGHAFAPGEKAHVNPLIDSQKFNDSHSMAGPGGGLVCDACAVVLPDQDFMLTYQKAYATLDGIFPLRKNRDIAHFLVQPPQPPFVVVWGLATQQHLFWRTPVALSNAIFPVRIGPTVGLIRREAVLSAWRIGHETYQRAIAFHEASRPPDAGPKKAKRGPAKTALSHPYLRLDRTLSSTLHGVLKPVVQRYLHAGPIKPGEQVLGELNAVEAWALAALFNLHEDHEAPPDPLTTRNPDLHLVPA